MRLLLPLFLLCTASAFAAENLIENSGFEAPVVSARTPQEKGGDPGLEPARSWIGLDFQQKADAGAISGGLTNEAHHGGTQALFIRFGHVSQSYQAALLTSNFIPVAPGTDYEVGIWGQLDPKDPITGKGRSAYLKLQVDYFAKDASESVGETVYAVQPLPGSKDHPAFYTSDSWKYFSKKVTTPPDAVFAQVTWRWETGSDPGETTGTMFFDDSVFVGPPAADPHLKPVPVADTPEPSATPEAGASPAAAATGTAASQ